MQKGMSERSVSRSIVFWSKPIGIKEAYAIRTTELASKLMNANPRLYVYMMGQDDPKKCSARRLAKLKLAIPIYRRSQVPKGALVLDPYAEKLLTPFDREIALKNGIVVVDCSWKNVETVFSSPREFGRRLPILLPANPINYARAGMLSSLEAFSGTLYILGFKGESQDLLRIFKWAPHFLELNKDPLEAYAEAKDEEQLITLMKEFFPQYVRS
jgi:pre-rRNA-processing protein TSR3